MLTLRKATENEANNIKRRNWKFLDNTLEIKQHSDCLVQPLKGALPLQILSSEPEPVDQLNK